MSKFQEYLEVAKTDALKAVQRDIEMQKTKLKNKPIKENFGRDVVKKLEAKYHDHRYCNDGVFNAINAFSDWCASYDGK